MNNKVQFKLIPIGEVKADERSGVFQVQVFTPFRDALQQLVSFSHVIVFWWADGHDNPQDRAILTTELPYARGLNAGVFACRSEYRPNPICITTMPILGLDEETGVLTLPWIDARDGSPVIDLKPYIPVSDRIRDFSVAEWMRTWPEWMEDAGAYFAENPIDFGD